MAIFNQNDKVSQPYEVISVVSVVGARSNVAIFNKIKFEAANLGADAVVGYYEGNSKYVRNVVKWGSGLAVRFVANSSTDTSFYKVSASIPHARILEKQRSEKRNIASDSIVRLLSQEMLTRKGYYAFLVNDSVPPFVFNPSVNRNVAKPTYSQQSDLILALALIDKLRFLPVSQVLNQIQLKPLFIRKTIIRLSGKILLKNQSGLWGCSIQLAPIKAIQ